MVAEADVLSFRSSKSFRKRIPSSKSAVVVLERPIDRWFKLVLDGRQFIGKTKSVVLSSTSCRFKLFSDMNN